jgi:hypothetical protein
LNNTWARGGGTWTFSGTITGTGAFVKEGGGTLTVSGARVDPMSALALLGHE